MLRKKNLEKDQIVARLEASIESLKKDNEKYFIEMVERGKDLNKLAHLIRGAKDLIPTALHLKMLDIIEKYEMRN